MAGGSAAREPKRFCSTLDTASASNSLEAMIEVLNRITDFVCDGVSDRSSTELLTELLECPVDAAVPRFHLFAVNRCLHTVARHADAANCNINLLVLALFLKFPAQAQRHWPVLMEMREVNPRLHGLLAEVTRSNEACAPVLQHLMRRLNLESGPLPQGSQTIVTTTCPTLNLRGTKGTLRVLSLADLVVFESREPIFWQLSRMTVEKRASDLTFTYTQSPENQCKVVVSLDKSSLDYILRLMATKPSTTVTTELAVFSCGARRLDLQPSAKLISQSPEKRPASSLEYTDYLSCSTLALERGGDVSSDRLVEVVLRQLRKRARILLPSSIESILCSEISEYNSQHPLSHSTTAGTSILVHEKLERNLYASIYENLESVSESIVEHLKMMECELKKCEDQLRAEVESKLEVLRTEHESRIAKLVNLILK